MSRVIGYEPCPKCRENGKDTRGDNLVRYSDESAFCFACHHVEPPRIRALLTQLLKNENAPKNKALPASFTREVPGWALQWLFQFGLGYAYWKDKIGFAPEESRLIFRVGNPLAFSIGRYVENPSVATHSSGGILLDGGRGDGSVVSDEKRKPRKWYAYGEPHKHCEVIHPDSGPGETVVLVEDIVSAHKVGRATTAIPLFGTQIHPPVLYYLMNQDKPVRLWLDKDQEHRIHKTVMHLQSMINNKVSVIITDKDPKWQAPATIEALVQ